MLIPKDIPIAGDSSREQVIVSDGDGHVEPLLFFFGIPDSWNCDIVLISVRNVQGKMVNRIR